MLRARSRSRSRLEKIPGEDLNDDILRFGADISRGIVEYIDFESDEAQRIKVQLSALKASILDDQSIPDKLQIIGNEIVERKDIRKDEKTILLGMLDNISTAYLQVKKERQKKSENIKLAEINLEKARVEKGIGKTYKHLAIEMIEPLKHIIAPLSLSAGVTGSIHNVLKNGITIGNSVGEFITQTGAGSYCEPSLIKESSFFGLSSTTKKIASAKIGCGVLNMLGGSVNSFADGLNGLNTVAFLVLFVVLFAIFFLFFRLKKVTPVSIEMRFRSKRKSRKTRKSKKTKKSRKTKKSMKQKKRK